MSNYNKKYAIGDLFLAEPYLHCIHKLPLLAFSDVLGSVELDLIYNSKNASENNFNIANGFKLNLQKRIINSNGTLTLENEQGMRINLAKIDNSHYLLQDTSGRMLRKKTYNGAEKYVLENVDMSKEIYDASGKLESCVDKYDNTLLVYAYDTSNNNRLKSITYRSEKKIELVYTSGVLTGVKYVVNGSLVCQTNLTHSSNKVLVKHYSGVDYHLEYSTSSYTAYSTAQGATQMDANSEKLQCARITDGLQFKIYNGSGVIIDTTTYTAVNYDGLEKYDLVEKTDKNGVRTRIQYENDIPAFSYELILGTEDAQFVNGIFNRNVNIHTASGVSGSITVNSGKKMTKISSGSGYKYNCALSSDEYDNNVIITGWVKASADNVGEIDFTNNSLMVCGRIKAPVKNKWMFFSFAYANKYQEVELLYSNATAIELKDVRLTVSKKTMSSSEYMLRGTNNVNHSLEKLKFRNQANGQEFDVWDVSGNDLMKYFLNKMRGVYSNEFYLYSHTNHPSMITNAGTITFTNIDSPSTTHTLNEFKLVKRIYRNEEYEDIEMDFSKTDQTFVVKYYDSNGNLDKTETFNKQCDITTAVEGGITTTYTRASNGALTAVSRTGGVGNVTYTYGGDYKTLLSEENSIGKVTYTTDDIWGVVTKAVVSKGQTDVTETAFGFADDKQDLTFATFGKSGTTSTNNITYTGGKVGAMSSGSVQYNFGYTNNDLTSVTKNGTAYKEFTYADSYKTINAKNHTSSSASYTVTKNLDNYGRVTQVSGKLTNAYALSPYFNTNGVHTNLGTTSNGSMLLSTQTDLMTNDVACYGYDDYDKLVRVQTKQGSTVVKNETFEYDDANRITKDTLTYTMGDSKTSTITTSYSTQPNSWKTDGRISKVVHTNAGKSMTTDITYDANKRQITNSKTINGIAYGRSIVYNTDIISSVKDTYTKGTISTTLSNTAFTYDALGRIVSEIDSVSNKTKKYTYDSIGRLTREDNQVLSRSYTYTYDSAGNITSRKTYLYTTGTLPSSPTATETFTYNSTHPDRLSTYAGKAITYDQQGCPLSYNGKTYTWTKGKLTSIVSGNISTGRETMTFNYNGNGQRTKKVYAYVPPLNGSSLAEYVSNETATYHYDQSGRLIGERITTTYGDLSSNVNNIHYLYDDTGIAGMSLNTSIYYFQRNIQGDVVAVWDKEGTKIVTFKYDAFGKCTVSGDTVLAQWCRIRYRGYYFDAETGLYWVQTRYYNPDWCRWISPDSISYLDPESPHGINLYLYCGNDPINYVDPSGCFPILTAILCGIALVGMGLTIGGVASDNNVMTAIGLTMVAVPALISGVGALFSGATYLSIIGGVTAGAGAFTGAFAVAEYQEAFTGNNWIIDTTGMSEGWYNGLMLATAAIATAGTIATGVLTSVGNAATPNQMMNSFNKHPNRWKTVKELVEPGRGAKKGGISTYSNYINKWTGSKMGIHKIIRGGRFIHGPHFHPWF